MILLMVVAVILAGIAGCAGTGLTFRAITGRPASVVVGNWRKHLWSVVFAVPMPFLLTMAGNRELKLVITLIVLALLPSIASKFYFGPKDAPWSRLLILHSAYALVAVTVYMIIIHIPLMLR